MPVIVCLNNALSQLVWGITPVKELIKDALYVHDVEVHGGMGMGNFTYNLAAVDWP
jgi:hypothetical protein